MLKHQAGRQSEAHTIQPPSGGCVLKLMAEGRSTRIYPPAAFGRLCVETFATGDIADKLGPAAFGRLCVETAFAASPENLEEPAAFGRLCVETRSLKSMEAIAPHQPPSGGCVLKPLKKCAADWLQIPSRLRAAVC